YFLYFHLLFFFFFFQAEDGIRDGHVTGVQTCALPIWQTIADRIDFAAPGLARNRRTGGNCALSFWRWFAGGIPVLERRLPRDVRSEERRVGKEWRCRGSADH